MLINCDMGESFGVWSMGVDELAMPHIDMANVACGGHASDPDVMSKTIVLAKQHKVSIGAHPSYADIAGFGRRPMLYSPAQLSRLLVSQIGSLQALCHYHGEDVDYVKPHGALYNDMHKDVEIFTAVIKAVASFNKPLKLMVSATLTKGFVEEIARQHHVELIREAFCDRRYLSNGQLQARTERGAVLTEQEELLSQVRLLLMSRQLKCNDGSLLAVQADTLCVHGDNEAAVNQIKHIRSLVTLNSIKLG
ncbi:5-oxoprolinase subunit PxpA [Agarivorans sp. TSD2052]|uniref:5-oxoprolinase subunit PxpA n=1 Tax=Agarivorans sp. TSD2052 TaxID=2937286 RepID=UPI00200DDFE1|nr:5-oxoprolinase subunit PxpA [Agarivorans sp. TSD2052]UPW20635.1 5-oxoprolinase subunit PxpA [Agarivorans sp. TSD2052]